jgi:hypothetical protein
MALARSSTRPSETSTSATTRPVKMTTVGPLNRGLGDAKEHCCLACHAQVVDELTAMLHSGLVAVDLRLGTGIESTENAQSRHYEVRRPLYIRRFDELRHYGCGMKQLTSLVRFLWRRVKLVAVATERNRL